LPPRGRVVTIAAIRNGDNLSRHLWASYLMCLGIPGKVVKVFHEHGLLMGEIDFGGVVKQACLETLPDVIVGEYVLIHVGFALAKVDEMEARQIFAFLEEMNELNEIQSPGDHEAIVAGRKEGSGA